jgi:hypothetical protein
LHQSNSLPYLGSDNSTFGKFTHNQGCFSQISSLPNISGNITFPQINPLTPSFPMVNNPADDCNSIVFPSSLNQANSLYLSSPNLNNDTSASASFSYFPPNLPYKPFYPSYQNNTSSFSKVSRFKSSPLITSNSNYEQRNSSYISASSPLPSLPPPPPPPTTPSYSSLRSSSFSTYYSSIPKDSDCKSVNILDMPLPPAPPSLSPPKAACVVTDICVLRNCEKNNSIPNYVFYNKISPFLIASPNANTPSDNVYYSELEAASFSNSPSTDCSSEFSSMSLNPPLTHKNNISVESLRSLNSSITSNSYSHVNSPHELNLSSPSSVVVPSFSSSNLYSPYSPFTPRLFNNPSKDKLLFPPSLDEQK